MQYIDSGYRIYNKSSTNTPLQGSYIIDQTCYAENPSNSDGVYAYARCCDFSQFNTIQCSTTKSALSGTANDEAISISCPQSTQTMLGWYAIP